MNSNALIVFTRNPELGKCKTRLAKSIGNHAALEVYKFLLTHTARTSAQVDVDRFVFYSENIIAEDLWDSKQFNKRLQPGIPLYSNDLPFIVFSLPFLAVDKTWSQVTNDTPFCLANGRSTLTP